MGVTGLLPQLKDIQENISLEKYRGKTVAIDSYAWLHRSVLSCPVELAQGLKTLRYVNFFKKRIMMFRHFGVVPFFVFDGDHFGSKLKTELDRSIKRDENKKIALSLVEAGNSSKAYEYFMKCIDVTPQMAKSVIELLKMEKIEFIVAPYEADSQMVYLEKIGKVDGIVSEDSDLLIFGAKKLLTKLNEFGECIEIDRSKFKQCKLSPIGLLNDSQLRMVACLSGCDYTSGINKVGIIKAFKLVQRFNSMPKILMNIRLEGKLQVDREFEKEYERADLSFQYQRVYNPLINQISTLNEVPKDLKVDSELLQECMGTLNELEVQTKIAYGELDPITKLPLIARDDVSAIKKTNSSFNFSTPKPSYRNSIIRFNSEPGPTSPPSTIKIRTKSMTTKRSNTDLPVSPTSKRKLKFNKITTGTPSISKFFGTPSSLKTANPKVIKPFEDTPSKAPPVSTKQAAVEIIEEKSAVIEEKVLRETVSPNTSTSTSLEFSIASSDFELTDPDEDDYYDDDKAVAASNITKQEVKGIKEEEKENNIRSLHERFAFKQTSTATQHSRPKLHTATTSTIKHKNVTTRSFTLDSFIYKASSSS